MERSIENPMPARNPQDIRIELRRRISPSFPLVKVGDKGIFVGILPLPKIEEETDDPIKDFSCEVGIVDPPQGLREQGGLGVIAVHPPQKGEPF